MKCTLLTPRQFAAETGWPERRIRNLLREQSLKHIKIGANYLLPIDAIAEYIDRNTIDPCQENTPVQDSSKKPGETHPLEKWNQRNTGSYDTKVPKQAASITSAQMKQRLSTLKPSAKKK